MMVKDTPPLLQTHSINLKVVVVFYDMWEIRLQLDIFCYDLFNEFRQVLDTEMKRLNLVLA